LTIVAVLVGLLGGRSQSAYAQGAAGWTFTGPLGTNRFQHTATRLADGRVLVVGGGGFPCAGNFCYSTVNGSAELYDPAAGTWQSAGRPARRTNHTATRLQNGQVLVAGGFNYGFDIGRFEYLNTAELYDPATGLWRPTASFNQISGAHLATLLPDGRVLAVGRSQPNGPVDSAELYDPATGLWSNTAAPRAGLPGTMTLLANGHVLLVMSNAAELYDPAAGRWADTGSLNLIRGPYTATLLPDDRVLVTGLDASDSVFKAELYDPAAGAWHSTGSPAALHLAGTATLLPGGRVLLAGGTGIYITTSAAEVYDPATGAWSPTGPLNAARFYHTETPLADGRVLVTGGVDGDFDVGTVYRDSTELYTPARTDPNPIDDPQFFVRQHYLDFLKREPEPDGLAAWLRVLADCPAADEECRHQARLTVSAAFFGSPEFQLKGAYVFRFYKLAFGRLPAYEEMTADMQRVSGRTPAEVYARKASFASDFARRDAFARQFGALSNAAYVAALLARYQLDNLTTPDPADPDGALKLTLPAADLVARLDNNTLTRAQVLRAVADSDEVARAEYNRAFVAMQYYGYLRRAPEPAGYQAWLAYLDAHPADYREMVRGFVDSTEYRLRF
jgi:hypothetical protein